MAPPKKNTMTTLVLWRIVVTFFRSSDPDFIFGRISLGRRTSPFGPWIRPFGALQLNAFSSLTVAPYQLDGPFARTVRSCPPPVPPVDNDAAPASPPPIESSSIIINEPLDNTPSAPEAPAAPTAPTTTFSTEPVKAEDSPAPSRLNSTDAETPGLDGGDDDDRKSTTTAGRKRKLSSLSARGVASLTPDQLAKKRANDRQAQRAIRERTKGHIDALEQQVRDLSSQKPIRDLQAALRQNEDTQAENKELRRGLKAVMDVIQPLLGTSEQSTLNPISAPNDPASIPRAQTQPAYTSNTPPLPDNNLTTPNSQRSATESLASVGTPSSRVSTPGGNRRGSADGTSSFRVAFDSQRHNLAHGLDFGTDERLGFNFLVDAAKSIPKVNSFRRNSDNCQSSHSNPFSMYAPPLDASATEQSSPAYLTPVRNIAPTCPLDAILLDFLHNRQKEAAQGVPKQSLVGPPYPSVSSLLNPDKSVYSHPVSKVFTDILRTFPNIASLPEQVAVLYMMFLLMRWQIYPTVENYNRLPDWLAPQPSQLFTPHPAWIDYLPWPRMRDHLVMVYPDYQFENWFLPFTESLSVNWPYEPTDCLLSTTDCEDLLINPVFERHVRNIGNWSLGPTFAEAFPALIDTTKIKPNVP